MYGSKTTSVPSIQRGSGSRRSTEKFQQHDGVVMVKNHLVMASPSRSPKGGAAGGVREVVVCGKY
jgi:hypothetical protein